MSAPPTTSPALGHRLTRHMRRYGLWATLREMSAKLRQAIVMDETHVWYELDLRRDFPRVPLPPAFRFRPVALEEAAVIETLPSISGWSAAQRIADGNDLWLVTAEDGTPAFACWTFRKEMPVVSAPDGTLALPPSTVCLEDSVTSPAFRGQGIAPAAWSLLMDRLRDQGVRSVITRIREDNTASRKAIVKCGFTEIVLARFKRVAGRRQASVKIALDTPAARSLADQLE